MEFSLTGNALKTFARSVTCLARIGNEVTLQASPSQLALHTLNSSRSAYQSITLKPAFFDVYNITGDQVQCSVLLKAVCSVLRTPLTSIDHLTVLLPDPDASKVQWTLDCYNGMKKSYWITCNIEADVQQLSLDRRRLPSSFVVRPRDLNRLLANFQSTLHEITVIATDPTLSQSESDAANEVGGKAVELRSYIDQSKENDSSLHTQLWIDPCEEFVQYTHSGDPVDVTFGVKELKAFLSFCEGCEVDIHLYFEKAGDNNTTTSHGAEEQPQDTDSHRHRDRPKGNVSEHPSDHTRIWSELSGSATKSTTGGGGERDLRNTNNHNNHDIHRISKMHISKADNYNYQQPSMQREDVEERQDEGAEHGNGGAEHGNNGVSQTQRHVSNWVDADAEDDEEEEGEPYIQATPPYYEEH
ncbi:uncharacterized protein LOC111895310 isoform X2 [Lactuca sativa]|uniref:uncharacterized protein LOC111895310 isoform X2 n=1 Tax=Lactuca sativa TaxID=4236 RepID=UPI0022AFFE00|nr:uncharacterized protein LOC111895310 isoform X2 [Lactuca sativa]